MDADDLRGMNTRWETTVGRIDILLAATGPHGTSITYRSIEDGIRTLNAGGTHLRMIGVDDLMVLKIAAGRPHDVDDVEQVLQAQRRGKPGLTVDPPQQYRGMQR